MRRLVHFPDGSVRLEQMYAANSATAYVSTEPFGQKYRILLIGAGAIAEHMATMALFNGFAVTVCDPCIEYLESWSIAGVKKTAAVPDKAIAAFNPNPHSCIVALSHDRNLDDSALFEALQSQAFYVGAIGTGNGNRTRLKRLMAQLDGTEEKILRPNGSIGIYIGGKTTPAEIAVSIMAEVLAVKNGVKIDSAIAAGHGAGKIGNEASHPDTTRLISHFLPAILT